LRPREGKKDPFVEGNIRTCSLEEIWHYPLAFLYNRHFTAADLTGHCAECTYAALCRGGAPCVAYALTGSLGCNPMCYHQVALSHARMGLPPLRCEDLPRARVPTV
jgi:radical SAM protein with 4Fe4S-binding SPASM domain